MCSISSYFMNYFKLKKFKFKHLIDGMTIDLFLSLNFASMENI